MWPLIIIFSPVILVAGEPVNRFVLGRMHRRAAVATWATATGRGNRSASVLLPGPLPWHLFLFFQAMRNPLWIALTAPGRWVSDQFRRPPSGLVGS